MIFKNKMFRKVVLVSSVMVISVLLGMFVYVDELFIKIGVMLLYSGVYVGLGEVVINGLK